MDLSNSDTIDDTDVGANDPELAGANAGVGVDTTSTTLRTSPIAPSFDLGPGPKPRPTAPAAPPAPVQAATFVASQRDPVRWAKVLQLSKQWNVAPDFADRNFDQLTQAGAKRESDRQLTDLSPTLANWLSDPDNATIATHELGALTTLDRSTSLLSRASAAVSGLRDAASTATATSIADLASSAGLLGVAYGHVDPAAGARFVADMQRRAARLRAQAPAYVQQSDAATAAASSQVDADVTALTASTSGTRASRILAALTRFATNAPEAEATIGDVLDEVRAAAPALPYHGVESLASMAPMLGGAMAGATTGAAVGSVVPLVGTAVGGVIGGAAGTFAGMAPGTVASEMLAQLRNRGVDVTNPDALARAFSDPALMASVQSKAQRAGVTNAAVVAALTPFAGLLAEGAAGAGLAARTAARAADVSIQAGAMGAGQAAGQAAAGDAVSAGQAIQTAFSTLGVSAGMEAIGSSRRAALHPETHEAAAQATAHADDALQAHQDAALLTDIGQAVHDAPTTAAVPDRLRDLVETAAGGADASTVYFQSEDWNKYFLARGESPAEQAAKVMGDGGRAYAEAQSTGAPLAIPLADYVAHVAPTAHFDGLLPAARMRPDGPSLAEAQSYLQDLPATMRDLASEATGATETPNAGAARARLVGQDVARQLVAVGTTPREAKANASLWEHAFRALAERTGQDPLDLYARYRLRIGTGDATAEDALEGAPATPLTRALEARRAVEGAKSVVEQSRAEGERRALERDANTDALTGLGNKRAYGESLAAAEADPDTKIIGLDINGAKETNDTLGHAAGDEMIRHAAATIREHAPGLPVFRTGGDEFRVFAPADQAEHIRNAIEAAVGVRTLEGPHIETGKAARARHSISAGIGDTDAEADAATYARKKIQKSEQGIGPRQATPASAGDAVLEQATAGTPRGRIRLSNTGIDIDLLANADRSTFLHETGHGLLHLLDTLGTGAHAAPELAADRATIRDWLGAEGDTPLTRDQHEQFARGFEAYLGEGKAPSEALRGVFARFQRWILGVYKDLRALNVTLSPDVRGVFDRLLASHDELEAARQAANVEPLFSDPTAVGMSDAQAARYRADVESARQAAEEETTARVMRQLTRERSQAWRALREPIEADVTKAVDAEPVYQARALMEHGTRPDGSALPEGVESFKLSKAAIAKGFGDAQLNGVPRGVIATEGGIHPDVAAELLGFGSGRALLDALRAAPNRADEIRARTDARMEAEHGAGRASDAELQDRAALTVRNEQRAQLLRRELEILASDHLATTKGLVRAVTRVVPSTEAVRAQAETIIGGKAVKDVKPRTYELAARRAATDARDALLKGDVQRAFDAKRRELLNTELLRSATKARDTIEAALDEFRKAFRRDATLAETRDMDLVNAARAILATFGIGQSEKPASAYLEPIRQYDPETYDTVVAMVNDATANARDYRELTVDDFHALHETVSSLWTMARRARQIEIDGQKLERRQVQDELTQRLHALGAPEAEPIRRAVTSRERAARTLMSARAWLRRVEHWADAMDGGDPSGVFRRYVWNPISEAATVYRGAKRTMTERYLAIVQPLEGRMVGGALPAPEIGYTFESPAELIGAMLHTGNESNLRKLLVGYGWGTLDEAGVVDRSRWDAFVRRMHAEGQLTQAHYEYLQKTWDLFEETKPGAQRAHREMFGRYFDEITAEPFATPFGTYAGGYFPAKADPFRVPDQAVKREAETLLGNDNAFMFPTTGRGFTKSRVEYNRPLIIDAAAVPAAIDAVLRFTHLEPHVRDVARIVTSRAFRPELDRFDATAGSDMLVPWLQRAAQQRIDVPGKFPALDRFWRQVRSRSGLNIMAASVSTALQMIGHAPAAALKVDPSALGGALWRYMRAPRDFAADVAEKSAFMRTRETAAVAEMEKSINHLMLNPSTYEQARAFAKEHGYFLTHGVQNAIDLMVWSGAYEQGARAGVSEAEAIRRADSAVRETQGSFAPEDLSRFETNTPFLRSLAMFYSFFNAKSNLLGTEVANARSLGLRKGAGRLLYVYTFGFLIPSVTYGLVRNAVTSGTLLDEQDDEGPLDAAMRLFFGSQFHMATGMIPGVGPIATSVVDSFLGKQPDALMGSPAVTAIEASARAPHDVYQAIHERLITAREIRDVLTLVGMLSGLPVAPLAKPLGYLAKVHTGDAQPAGAADVARGLVTGR